MAQTCNAKPGDLIAITHLLYKHWVVYIGGDEVVHFGKGGGSSGSFGSSCSSGRGIVKREKFTKVDGYPDGHVNNLLDEKYVARDPSIIVKEACAMVGPLPKYDVAGYNCEHFATEMRYGKAESRQVRNATIVATAGYTAGTLAAAAGTGAALAVGAPVIVAGCVVGGVVALCGAAMGFDDLLS
ncbi:phospholipase A and acyltransferase 4-like isoform X2 [Limanda limanda]|uniref:phospholipase A and acyltransferase 4-like isoform X2 n=1 Tax=Limanda limanda TaxID=27771 RepID=UPI0029C834F2|nr:phospholipase A and acyltransferase 4-like isoform X2 [Limanda limanda]